MCGGVKLQMSTSFSCIYLQERPDVRYSLLAVDFMPPAVLGQLLRRVAARLASGSFQPLRSAAYNMNSVAAAMRLLAQAGHVGKVVVSSSAAAGGTRGRGAGNAAGSMAGAGSGSAGLLGNSSSEASLLVTGGTGALGLLIACK